MSGLTRDPKLSGVNRNRENEIFSLFQLTSTSRIGKRIQFMPSLLKVMTTHRLFTLLTLLPTVCMDGYTPNAAI